MNDTDKPMRDCESVARSLWEYLDNELEDVDAEEIRAHLEACHHCRSHADFEEHLMKKVSGLRREHSDPASLKSKVLEMLRDAGMETGSS